nr:MAG TPA: hypothetical protein [Caudoviricetes sp.]
MGRTRQHAPPDADRHASEPPPHAMRPKTPASCSATGLE